MRREFPVVLMIDEVDSVSDNQALLDFLGQLRACYHYIIKLARVIQIPYEKNLT